MEWSDAGGIDETQHAEYLDELCKAFRESVRKQVDAGMEKRAKMCPGSGDLHAEVLQHLHTCLGQCTRIYGRDGVLQRVRHYVMDDIAQPLILHGAPGVGKTCVLAKAASLVSD